MIYIKQKTVGIIGMAGGLFLFYIILSEEETVSPMVYVLMIIYFVVGLWVYRNHLPILGKYSKGIDED